MESSILYLVVGFFCGILVCALSFLVFTNSAKKKQSDALEQRNQLIHSIAVNFTDIDTLITSFRTGLVAEEKFRSSLLSRLDTANRIFKPNMHLFDLYYVKYIEGQFVKYSEFAHGKVTDLHLDGKTDFENEFSSSDSFQPVAVVSPGEEAADFAPEAEVFPAGPADVIEKDKAEIEIEIEKDKELDDAAAVVEQNQIDEFDFGDAVDSEGPLDVQIVSDPDKNFETEVPSIVFSSLESDEKPVVTDEKPVVIDEKPVVIDEKPVVVDEKPVIIDEEPLVIVEELPAVQDTKPEDPEAVSDEIIFEVGVGVSGDKKGSAPISDTTIEMAKKGDSIGPEISTDQSAEESKSSFQKEFEQAISEPQDEDLMETIMDLDMGKFLRTTGSIKVESIDKTAIPPKYATPSNRAPDKPDTGKKTRKPSQKTLDNSAGALQETSIFHKDTFNIEPAESSNKQEKIIVARGDESGSDTVLDEAEAPADFEVNTRPGEIKDVAITGDDVANKIDSFFGIK